jgi:hypothetical protein
MHYPPKIFYDMNGLVSSRSIDSQTLYIWIHRMLVTLGKKVLFIFDNMDAIWNNLDHNFDLVFANLTNIPSV